MKYVVRLSNPERQQLETLICKGKQTSNHATRWLMLMGAVREAQFSGRHPSPVRYS